MSGAIHGHDDHELDFVGSRLPGTMLGFRGLPVYHWWISWDFEIFQWNIVGYIYIYIYHSGYLTLPWKITIFNR